MEVAQHHQHDLLLLSLGQLLPLHGSLRLQLQPPHPLHLAQQQLLLLLQHPQRHVPGAPPAERARVCGAEKALLVDSVDPAVVPVLRLSQGPGDDAAVVAGAAGLLEAREVGAQLRDLPPDVLLLAVVLALVLLPVLRRVGAPPQLLELPAELPEVGGQLVDLVPLRVQLGLGGLDLLLEHRGSEVSLLRLTLPKLIAGGAAQALSPDGAVASIGRSYRGLLRGLQLYFGGAGAAGPQQAACRTLSSSDEELSLEAFLEQVQLAVEQRERWHNRASMPRPASLPRPKPPPPQSPPTPPPPSPPRRAAPKLAASKGGCVVTSDDVHLVDGSSRLRAGGLNRGIPLPRARTQAERDPVKRAAALSILDLLGAKQAPHKVEPAALHHQLSAVGGDFKQAASVEDGNMVVEVDGEAEDQPVPKAKSARTESQQNPPNLDEVEWPEGNAACEGCGRFTFCCEAWSNDAIILCEGCRKARAPMMWALASEAARLQAVISSPPMLPTRIGDSLSAGGA
mmetsp:Transcript_91119/g.256816  ORF Transcript_91119/g.256816 Transcript_91119/m.256816 type:complete len:511 (+) Transcript_91119:1497-3029(+)